MMHIICQINFYLAIMSIQNMQFNIGYKSFDPSCCKSFNPNLANL